VDFYRNIMLVSVCGKETQLLEVPGDLRPLFVTLAAKYDAPTLVHLIALCEQTLRSLKATTMARPLFDALIVRLAMAEQFSSIKEMLQVAASGGTGSAAPEKKNDITGGKDGTGGMVLRSSQGHAAPTDVAPSQDDDDDDDLPAPGKVWKREDPAQSPVSVPAAGLPAAASAADDEGSIYKQLTRQLANAPVAVTAHRPASGRPAVASLTGKSNMVAVSPQREAEIASAVAQVLAAAPPETLEEVWQQVRRYLVATKNGSINTMLGPSATLLACDWESGQATVAVPPNLEAFTRGRPAEKIAEALGAIFKRPMKVAVAVGEEAAGAPSGHGDASRAAGPALQRVSPEVDLAVRSSAVIRNLQEKLGGDVSAVELLDQE